MHQMNKVAATVDKILHMLANWVEHYDYKHRQAPMTEPCAWCDLPLQSHTSEELAECIKRLVQKAKEET